MSFAGEATVSALCTVRRFNDWLLTYTLLKFTYESALVVLKPWKLILPFVRKYRFW